MSINQILYLRYMINGTLFYLNKLFLYTPILYLIIYFITYIYVIQSIFYNHAIFVLMFV